MKLMRLRTVMIEKEEGKHMIVYVWNEMCLKQL